MHILFLVITVDTFLPLPFRTLLASFLLSCVSRRRELTPFCAELLGKTMSSGLWGLLTVSQFLLWVWLGAGVASMPVLSCVELHSELTSGPDSWLLGPSVHLLRRRHGSGALLFCLLCKQWPVQWHPPFLPCSGCRVPVPTQEYTRASTQRHMAEFTQTQMCTRTCTHKHVRSHIPWCICTCGPCTPNTHVLAHAR